MIIDDLPSISIANDSDEIAIEQGTATKKITKGNFLQEVTSAISSLLSSLSGKVSKAGDTMSGNLTVENSAPGIYVKATDVTDGVAPPSDTNQIGCRVTDKDGKNIAIFTDMEEASGRQGAWIAGGRNNVYNSLYLFVNSSGQRVVSVSDAAAWRSALGLCYAVNDTFTSSGKQQYNGFITTSATQIIFDVHVPKSMESISTVAITTFSGAFRGVSGYIDSGNDVNYITTSGYTVAASKLNNYVVRCTLTKSSAFSNVTNNTPVSFWGTLTLKFT